MAAILSVAAALSAAAAEPALTAELERVRAALAVIPESTTGTSGERRRLLERIETSISRQQSANATIERHQARLTDIEAELAVDAPVHPEPIGPEAIDELITVAINANRDLITMDSLIGLQSVQVAAARSEAERASAAERAIVEDASQDATARELARLRVQDASAALRAIVAEKSASTAQRTVGARALDLARRNAFAAADVPLDEAALQAFLALQAQRVDAATAKSTAAMVDLADRQIELADARAQRDQLAAEGSDDERRALQRRVDLLRARTDHAEFALRVLRIEVESAETIAAIWRARADAMTTESLRLLPDTEKLIANTRERLSIGREYFLAVQNDIQTALDALATEVETLPSDDSQRKLVDAHRRELRTMRPDVLRALTALSALSTFIESSEVHLQFLERQQSFSSRANDFATSTFDRLGALWRYELFTVEDTIEVDGQQITGRLGVTVAKITSALLLLTAGVWLASLIIGLLRRLMIRRGATETGAALTTRLLNLAAIAVLVIAAFSVVNIPLTVFGFVGGALALGVGLGAQNMVNNFISGMIVLLERTIEIGHVVEIDGVRGTVRAIAPRFSQVRRFDGVDIVIPNSQLIEQQVLNLTLDDSQIRVTIRVGVAYGSNTRLTSECLLEAAKSHGQVLDSPPPFVLFEDFGDSALIFSINVWLRLNPSTNSSVTMSDLRYMIERNLREAGIEISFPQRDVHLDVKGPVDVRLDHGSRD